MELTERHCSWRKPNVGWYTLNSDKACVEKKGGLGVVLRVHSGEVVIAVHRSSKYFCNAHIKLDAVE